MLSNDVKEYMDVFKLFNPKEDNLDHFFFHKLTFEIPSELQSLLKMVLVLSHGQAGVERLFNINKTVSKVNMKDDSIVARKMIIDHMQKKDLSPAPIDLSSRTAWATHRHTA